jgi:hypothetical protein
VDIDIETPRIAMVTCDAIASLVPFIVESVTEDLARQKVSAKKNTSLLLRRSIFKCRYLALDDALRERQAAAEAVLVATGLFRQRDHEPPWEIVKAALKTKRSPLRV